MSRYAIGADPVADEPGEQAVFLRDLRDETPRDAVTTAAADRALGPGDRRRGEVLAPAFRVPYREVRALTRLAAAPEGDLVDAGGLVLSRRAGDSA